MAGARNASAIRAARLRAARPAGIAAANRLNWNAGRPGLDNRVRPGGWAGVNNRPNAWRSNSWNRYGNNWNRPGYRYWRPYYGFAGGRWNNWGWNRWAWWPWARLVPGIRFWPWFGGYGYGYGNYGYNNGSYGYSNYSSSPSTTYYDQSTYAPTYVDQQAASADQPAPTAAATATASADSNRFADEGETLFREGKYREAAQSFRHALVEDPQNGVLIQLLAQALFATEQYDEAAAAVQQSLMMLSEEQWGLVPANARELYSSQAAFDSQLSTLKRAVEGNGEGSPAERFLLAYQLGFSGQRQAALDQLAEVRKAVPEDQASERLEEVLKKGPDASTPSRETLPAPNPQPGSR